MDEERQTRDFRVCLCLTRNARVTAERFEQLAQIVVRCVLRQIGHPQFVLAYMYSTDIMFHRAKHIQLGFHPKVTFQYAWPSIEKLS